jgi:hypothetical protein
MSNVQCRISNDEVSASRWQQREYWDNRATGSRISGEQVISELVIMSLCQRHLIDY